MRDPVLIGTDLQITEICRIKQEAQGPYSDPIRYNITHV